jgi:hypothetical protein
MQRTITPQQALGVVETLQLFEKGFALDLA